MPYASSSDVAAYCRNITGSEIDFTSETSPNIDQVNAWLSSGSVQIDLRILAKGYSVPASGTLAFNVFQDCNALYAAARVELSRTNVTLAPGQRTRGQVFDEMWKDCVKQALEGDLTFAGLQKNSTGGLLYVGGISIDDKQNNEQDSDLVKGRFQRGQFDFEDTIQPTGTTAS